MPLLLFWHSEFHTIPNVPWSIVRLATHLHFCLPLGSFVNKVKLATLISSVKSIIRAHASVVSFTLQAVSVLGSRVEEGDLRVDAANQQPPPCLPPPPAGGGFILPALMTQSRHSSLLHLPMQNFFEMSFICLIDGKSSGWKTRPATLRAVCY